MSRSQWSREQRRWKVERDDKEKMAAESSSNIPFDKGKNVEKDSKRVRWLFEAENF